MNEAFEKWFKDYYIKHGFISSKAEAEESFRVGMLAAAEKLAEQAKALDMCRDQRTMFSCVEIIREAAKS